MGFLGGHTRGFQAALAAEEAGTLHSDLESVLDALPEFSGNDSDGNDGGTSEPHARPQVNTHTSPHGSTPILTADTLNVGVATAGKLQTSMTTEAVKQKAAKQKAVKQQAPSRAAMTQIKGAKTQSAQPKPLYGSTAASTNGPLSAVAAAAAAMRRISAHISPTQPAVPKPARKAQGSTALVQLAKAAAAASSRQKRPLSSAVDAAPKGKQKQLKRTSSGGEVSQCILTPGLRTFWFIHCTYSCAGGHLAALQSPSMRTHCVRLSWFCRVLVYALTVMIVVRGRLAFAD